MGVVKTTLLVVASAIALVMVLGFTSAAAYFAGVAHGGGASVGAQSYDVAPDAQAALALRAYRFAPAELRVPAGQLVELVVTNEDEAHHTFTYDARGETFDHALPGGETTRILVRFDAGEIPFWCKPHGSAGDGMHGTIIVEE